MKDCVSRKISEFPFAHCIRGTELIPIVQDGENKIITINNLFPNEDKKPCGCKEWNPNWNPCDSWGHPEPRPHEDDLVKKAFSKATVAQADSELALTKIQELNFALEKLRVENYNMSTQIQDLTTRLANLENKMNQNNG